MHSISHIIGARSGIKVNFCSVRSLDNICDIIGARSEMKASFRFSRSLDNKNPLFRGIYYLTKCNLFGQP